MKKLVLIIALMCAISPVFGQVEEGEERWMPEKPSPKPDTIIRKPEVKINTYGHSTYFADYRNYEVSLQGFFFAGSGDFGEGQTGIGLNLIGRYRVNSYFAFGIGVGFGSYTYGYSYNYITDNYYGGSTYNYVYEDISETIVPLFANLEISFSKDAKWTPYLSLSCGYAIAADAYIDAIVGAKQRVNDIFSWNAGLGYTYCMGSNFNIQVGLTIKFGQ